MRYLRPAGCVLLILSLVILVACGETRKAAKTVAHALTPTLPTKGRLDHYPNCPAPKTSADWQADAEHWKNERDIALQLAHDDDVKVEQSEKRAQEQKAAEITAQHEHEAAIGRWLAAIVFALGTAATIISFVPVWGAFIPKWAGPFGMGASIAILVAAQVWVWVANHIMTIALGTVVIGVVIALIVFHKGLLKAVKLLRIRQTYHDAMETATNEADELTAKANSLEAEIKAGVHSLGQALRKKPLKTLDDVVLLRNAASDALATKKA